MGYTFSNRVGHCCGKCAVMCVLVSLLVVAMTMCCGIESRPVNMRYEHMLSSTLENVDAITDGFLSCQAGPQQHKQKHVQPCLACMYLLAQAGMPLTCKS